jgi:hypothetical protein
MHNVQELVVYILQHLPAEIGTTVQCTSAMGRSTDNVSFMSFQNGRGDDVVWSCVNWWFHDVILFSKCASCTYSIGKV